MKHTDFHMWGVSKEDQSIIEDLVSTGFGYLIPSDILREVSLWFGENMTHGKYLYASYLIGYCIGTHDTHKSYTESISPHSLIRKN